MFFVRWIPTFLATSLGALIATRTVGPTSDLLAACAAGAIIGAVTGLFQWAALGRIVDWRWPIGTTVAFAGGFAAAMLIAGPPVTTAAAMLTGFLTGATVGLAQGLLLCRALRLRGRAPRIRTVVIWTGTLSVTWAVAWLLSSSAEIAQDRLVFGTGGALPATLVAGIVLRVLLDARLRRARRESASSPVMDAAATVIAASRSSRTGRD
jgi:hypothetical protein